MFKSFGELIDALGGTGAVSNDLGFSSDSTVSGWRKRGIPSTRWLSICELAKAKKLAGVSMELLARLSTVDGMAAERATEEARP